MADVFARFGGASKQWRTMLVVGQRAGGTAYTALDDVTSGKGFNDSTSPARFLWELTDPTSGESWSDPAIERVRDAAGANERAWGVYSSAPGTPRTTTPST